MTPTRRKAVCVSSGLLHGKGLGGEGKIDVRSNETVQDSKIHFLHACAINLLIGGLEPVDDLEIQGRVSELVDTEDDVVSHGVLVQDVLEDLDCFLHLRQG